LESGTVNTVISPSSANIFDFGQAASISATNAETGCLPPYLAARETRLAALLADLCPVIRPSGLCKTTGNTELSLS